MQRQQRRQRRQQEQRNKSKTTTRKKKNKQQLVLWVLLGVSMAMGWMGRVAEAAFAPRSRAELVPSSGEGGVFGCVGACGASLNTYQGVTYCSSSAGSWRTGTGVCVNADTDVPSGQGTGKYGAIGSWDVSAVESLRTGAWDFFLFFLLSSFFDRQTHTSLPLPPPHFFLLLFLLLFLPFFFILFLLFSFFSCGCSPRGFESRPYPMQHSATPTPLTSPPGAGMWAE